MYFHNINRSTSAKNSFQEVASTGLKTYLNFGWGFVPDPTWGAYSEPQTHSYSGEGLVAPLQEPHSRLGASGFAASTQKHPENKS